MQQDIFRDQVAVAPDDRAEEVGEQEDVLTHRRP
jgi:hypothetical protein